MYSLLAAQRHTREEIGKAFQAVCGPHDEFVMEKLAAKEPHAEIEKQLFEAAMKKLAP